MKKRLISFLSIIALTILCVLIFIQHSKRANTTSKPTVALTSIRNPISVINFTDITKKKLPLDLFFQGYILNSDDLISTKNDRKNIYSYNVKNGTINIIASVYDSNNFIKTITCNSEWIVWVEDEVLMDDTSNKPFQWQMIAQNIASGKKHIIDKSSFISNKYKVPMFINYTPDKLSIYNNTLVYCKTVPNSLKVKTELIKYEIDSNKRNIITSTNDVMNEMIADCSLYDNTIVWSKYKEINNNYEERLTQYKFSDLFIYDLNTKIHKQLTYNDFFHNPSIFKDKIAAIKIPLKKSNQNACNSEVVLINLTNNQVQTIVDENSLCYDKIENELYRFDPTLNGKYLTWNNNVFNSTYIYNYNTNKFINLTKVYENPSIINRIYAMYDNYVLLYKTSDQQKDNKSICIPLDNIQLP